MSDLYLIKQHERFSKIALSKEELIELARKSGLVFNEEIHPLGILRHHRKAIYDFANLVISNNFEQVLAEIPDS